MLVWALYLLCVDGGQTLYGFGWETSLIEAGFLAIFVGNSTPRRGCSPWSRSC
jgi:hypothetical protein